MSWVHNRAAVAEQEVDLARREVIAVRKRLNDACDDRDMKRVRRLRDRLEAAKDRREASRDLLWEAEG